MRVLKLASAAGAIALIAGCGGGTTSDGRLQAAGDRGMTEFATCMRAHGTAMGDPVPRPGHAGLSIQLPPQAPATAAAYKTCGHYLQPIIEEKRAHAPAITAAVRLSLIHYAGCMRTYGVPMLDPTGQGSLNLGNVPGMGEGFGRYTPQFHSADRSCRHLLAAGVHDDGSGP